MCEIRFKYASYNAVGARVRLVDEQDVVTKKHIENKVLFLVT